MKVTVEDSSTVKKIMHIEIDEKEVIKSLNEAYNTMKKTAKIKGFRPGKAPRSVLERLYRKDVEADVSSKLIQEAFVDALKETELKIVGSPKVDPPKMDPKGPYRFDAEIEVRPEIADIEFKDLVLKKTVYRANDNEIDTQLKMLQKNMAKQEPIKEERPVKKEDYVLIDYEGFKDGKPFEETGKAENFTMKIGDGHISKDFDDGIVGMNVGDEKELTVTFPEDYFNKKLANQEILFKVKLNEIREQILPEIDDEMAKGLGPFDSLDALKEKIVENLTQGYEKRMEQELNEQIFEQLLDKTEFEVPDTLVQYELDAIISDAERSFQYHNKTFEEAGITKESLAEKYRDTAKKQARRQLILGKIIEQEKLELSDEDLDKGFEEMAAVYNQPTETVKNLYKQDDGRLEGFKYALLEKQAIKLIMDSSKIEEIEQEKEPETQAEDA